MNAFNKDTEQACGMQMTRFKWGQSILTREKLKKGQAWISG